MQNTSVQTHRHWSFQPAEKVSDGTRIKKQWIKLTSLQNYPLVNSD